MGWLGVALYLKASAVCLQRYYGGCFDRHQPLPFPVSLTRTGLPRRIPSFHRAAISRRDEKADKLVRLYLSFFSISKLILVNKRQDFQYKSIVTPAVFSEKASAFFEDYTNSVIELAERYIPKAFDIPMKIEFRWLPTWTASSVRTKGNPLWKGIQVDNPFLRMIWDIYALSLWDKFMLFNPKAFTAQSKSRVWPFKLENLDWASRYIIPVVSLFCSTRTVFPSKGMDPYDEENFPWTLEKQVSSVQSLYCKAADYLQYLLIHCYTVCRKLIKPNLNGMTDDEQMLYFAPGRLAFKAEGAGKVRVFCIPNAFKQALLRPAHDWCMSVLRTLRTDGTYNQTGPLKRLVGTSELFSFDLSSATDRFPLSIQAMTVSALFDSVTAFGWVMCGLGVNAFSCQASKSNLPESFKIVRFATGQPLGLLSSWPLFALCHHFIVWYCANKVYPGRRFLSYALLGDDIVIGDKRVAEQYLSVMDLLGVAISKAKSLTSTIGALEFAKTFRIHERDLSPVSIKMQRTCCHSVAWMPVCRSVGVDSFRVSLRLRGAGYRRYSSQPSALNINHSRHWFRHM